jgi:hypothetical protein
MKALRRFCKEVDTKDTKNTKTKKDCCEEMAKANCPGGRLGRKCLVE